MGSLRKIELMHSFFGKTNGMRCKDCNNLIRRFYHARAYCKCLCYGDSYSEATDWRVGYTACGLYNKEYTGRKMVELVCHAKENESIPGQISLFGNEVEG